MSQESIYEVLYLYSEAYVEYHRLECQLRLLNDIRAGIAVRDSAACQETLSRLFQLPALTKRGLARAMELQLKDTPETQEEEKRLISETFRRTMGLWRDMGELRGRIQGEEYRAAREELRRAVPWQTEG